MKVWLKELERALSRKFYEEEVKDIISFYEEVINDRVSNGELLDDILSGCDIQKIVKDMMPEVLMKRENKSYVQVSKSTRQLLILLLGSPILVPLGIIYISILIFVMSMIFTSGILIFTSIIGFGSYVIDLFSTDLSIPNLIGTLGFGLMIFSMMILIAIWLYQLMILIWKKMIFWFSKVAQKRGEHE